ncbi:MAG: hypothetical protein GY869_28200 [Planctomycetes bacterium]|nr:hypothetical protein [Planctomycetota bacterium]
MSALTDAQELLEAYRTAEIAILKNQAYTIKDRTFTRADLRWVQAERRRLEALVPQLSSGGIRSTRGLPRDL